MGLPAHAGIFNGIFLAHAVPHLWTHCVDTIDHPKNPSENAFREKVGYRKTEAWQTLEDCRYSLHWSRSCGVQRNCSKCAEKVGCSDASSNALQTSTWQVQVNLSHSWRNTRQKDACIVEADESVRKRMEGSPHKNHEDHTAGKDELLSHHNLVRKFILNAQSNENTRCESSIGQRIGKTRENTGMAADESQEHKRGDRWSKERWQNRALRVFDRHLSSQEFGVGTKSSKIQRPSCAPRWHCKRLFRLLCSIHRARFICVTNDGCKSIGCHRKTTRMRKDKQHMQYQPGQNGRCTMVIENSKVRMSRYLDTVHQNTNGPNHARSSMEDPVFLLQRNLYGHPLAGLSEKKGLFLSVYVDGKKLAGKKQNIEPMWKVLMKDVDLG